MKITNFKKKKNICCICKENIENESLEGKL